MVHGKFEELAVGGKPARLYVSGSGGTKPRIAGRTVGFLREHLEPGRHAERGGIGRVR